MYCTNCGQRLADDARHCPNCGVAVAGGTAAQEFKAAEETTENVTATQESSKAPEPEKASAQESFKKSEQAFTDANAYTAGAGQQTPHYTQPEPVKSSADGKALAGLLLSIAGALTCCVPFLGLPLTVLGLIFSILGLKSEERHTMAIIAVVISGLFLVCNVMMGLGYLSVFQNREAWTEVMNDFNEYPELFPSEFFKY